MRRDLTTVAPAFVEMAHSIGMCIVATTGAGGQPHTRVMQPVWEWDGTALSGWASTTTTDSPKLADIARTPLVSLTYWSPDQDTCSADCTVEIETTPAELAASWDRFLAAPAPAGFDPAIHPDWETSASPTFGVIRLTPTWLRVMPGTRMLSGDGEVLTWRAGTSRSSPRAAATMAG